MQSAMMDDEPHPAEGGGPTIQALPMMMETQEAIREPLRSEPPTLMEPAPGSSSNNDGPTMMANPQARAMMMHEVESAELMPLEPESEEGEDETVVANAG